MEPRFIGLRLIGFKKLSRPARNDNSLGLAVASRLGWFFLQALFPTMLAIGSKEPSLGHITNVLRQRPRCFGRKTITWFRRLEIVSIIR